MARVEGMGDAMGGGDAMASRGGCECAWECESKGEESGESESHMLDAEAKLDPLSLVLV